MYEIRICMGIMFRMHVPTALLKLPVARVAEL